MPGRASRCGPMRSEGLDLKKSRKYFRIRTIWIRGSMHPSNIAPSGGVGARMYSLIFEVREDSKGEYFHLVTLWKSTRKERTLYEENS